MSDDEDLYAPAPGSFGAEMEALAARSAELAAKFRDGTESGETAARIVERNHLAFVREFRAIQNEALARALESWGFEEDE